MKSSRLGILAGGGELPIYLIAECIAHNRPYIVITFEDQPQPAWPTPTVIDDEWIVQLPLGAVGRVIKTLHNADVTEVVMAGNLERSSLFSLKPDWQGIKILTGALLGQDDALLRRVMRTLEDHGFTIRGAHEVSPDLLTPKGTLTKAKPSRQQLADIQHGLKLAAWLGAADVGQAVIIKDGVVLGLEAVEGTDALIQRCAALRGEKNVGGVLVKVAKPQQDARADLPTIGEHTLKLLAEYRFDGVALEAGRTLFLGRDACVTMANRASLFIEGATLNDAGQ